MYLFLFLSPGTSSSSEQCGVCTIIGNCCGVCVHAWLQKKYSAYLPYWCLICNIERIKPFPSAVTALYYSPRLFDGYAIRTVSVHLGLLNHISHIFNWRHIPGVDTVLHCEVMCLAWSPSSICVVFFIDSHYIGSHVWCTARGLKIIGACLSHSHTHRRTNNTNIIKWSSQLSALQHQNHLVVDSIYVKVLRLCKETACWRNTHHSFQLLSIVSYCWLIKKQF